jgi:hypothetical protein
VTIVDRRCLVEEASAMQKEAQLGSIEAISSANRSRSCCSPRPCARRRTSTVLSKPLLCAMMITASSKAVTAASSIL